MQKLVTFLWFDHEAEEAARFYTSIFKNSSIDHIARYGEEVAKAAGRLAGSVMLVEFTLNGQRFMALNGRPPFTFNEAVSLLVNCDSQEEVDTLWAKLTDGGAEVACGWLKDKYGLSWQIVPAALIEMLHDTDPVRHQRVMSAMMQMVKLDLATLQRAHDGK